MTRDYETDAVVRDFVDKYDFYFAPVLNPDGYQYCWDVVSHKKHSCFLLVILIMSSAAESLIIIILQ